MSEDEDDETGSVINVKVTSSQTKTPPNIVGKTIQFYFERYDKSFLHRTRHQIFKSHNLTSFYLFGGLKATSDLRYCC